LLAPHIARYFTRDNQAFVIPMACVWGAGLLLGADVLIRLVTVTRLPVGIVTSFMGAPVFLVLLLRRNSHGP
jgi:iron complex transport system permease protein